MTKTPTPVLNAAFVCQALQIQQGKNLLTSAFRAVSIDSRTVGEGDLFLALKGEAFDGHEFIESAFQKGAAAAICEKSYSARSDRPHFFVDDTLAAYRRLAAAWRQGFSLPVVVIAGAVGKTTTKEMVAAALSGRFGAILKTEGSENGFVGIPKTLLRLTPAHQVAVIEIGIDAVGAMAQHLELVQPTAAVVTAIAEEHMEHLGTLERVAEEEGQALTWTASRGGVVAINNNDRWLAPFGSRIGGRMLIYHLSPPAAGSVVPHLQAVYDNARGELLVSGMGWKQTTFPTLLPGAHNAQNLLAAIAVARTQELGEEQIRRGLRSFQPPYGRSQVKSLKSGLRVVCDYYNASPASMRAAMKLVEDIDRPRRGKRWACLGDMLELGTRELDLHRELAPVLIENGFDGVLLFGPRIKALGEELKTCGYTGAVQHFETTESLADSLRQKVKPDDIVLIKGSRGMKMERVFAQLGK